MSGDSEKSLNRRTFLGAMLVAGTAPLMVPSRVLGGDAAPSNLLRIGCIGVGRMGQGNMQEAMGQGMHAGARVVAVCDVDRHRVQEAKNRAEARYREILGEEAAHEVAPYGDYRELLAREDIDGVVISTPETWHGLIGIDAARAGKGMYIEKPLVYSIREGQALVKAVRASKVALQVGSQQRSSTHFHRACWLVRNGRIGKIKEIVVQNPQDQGHGRPDPMPVPGNLDYDRWMGPTAVEPYTEDRVHPQRGYGRPGWLQIQKYCLGMLTGWGSHMYDIAQWGLGTDLDSGPVEIKAEGDFPDRGLFDVHTRYSGEAVYANGVRMTSRSDGQAGVRFIGEDGWIWVQRGSFEAHDREVLRERPEGGITLRTSNNHMRDFLECLRSGDDPVATVEAGHRTNTVCWLHHIAMKLGRPVKWDPQAEAFDNDPEADQFLDYERRAGYEIV